MCWCACCVFVPMLPPKQRWPGTHQLHWTCWTNRWNPTSCFMCTHSIYCTNQNVFMQLEADFNSEAKRVLGCSTSGQMKCCSSMDINSVLSHSQTFPSSLFPHPTLVHFPPRLSLCQCHTYFDTCGLAADDGGVCFFFLCLKVESGW